MVSIAGRIKMRTKEDEIFESLGIDTKLVDCGLDVIRTEYARARSRFGTFNSPHEGFAVLEEEFLELRKEVFEHGSAYRMHCEAVQVAAMALAFTLEACRG
jgi:hypothetical protein